MSKFSMDYSGLANNLVKKAFKLSDVKDRLEVVAFDVVRFKDDDEGANLWQVQKAEDGDYIVALYQPDEETKTASEWSVLVSKASGDLQVSYKGDPIVRIASSKLGIPSSEIHQVPGYLPNKLATNKKLVKSLLNMLSEQTKKAVLNKYPELV